MPYDRFKLFDFSKPEVEKIDKRLKAVHKKYSNLLHIVELPLRRATIETVRSVLEDLKAEYDFTPKLICLDSADHLRGVGKFEGVRLEQTEVYWDCAALAQEGYAVWTSTHAGREWAEKVAEAEAAGESYDKARIADIVLTLNTPKKKTRTTRVTTDDDDDEAKPATPKPSAGSTPKGKYVELYLAKYRDGDSKLTIPLDAQFSRMYIRELEEGDDDEE
jgi:hypothetical protein